MFGVDEMHLQPDLESDQAVNLLLASLNEVLFNFYRVKPGINR